MSKDLVRSNTVAIDVYKSPTSSMLSICGKAVGVLNGLCITKDNIMIVLKTIMEAVETVKVVQQSDKKTLALDCLHWIINQQSVMPEAERVFLNNFVDTVAPPAIDIIVAASKGLTEINHKIESCCFSMFSCCFSDKKSKKPEPVVEKKPEPVEEKEQEESKA